jgi:hypothetical protein
MKRRLRMIFTSEDDSAPAGQKVVFRVRLALVILLGAFLAMLCLPSYRGTVEDQVRIALLRKPPIWTDHGRYHEAGEPGPMLNPHPPRIAAVLRRHPNDAHLHAGALVLGYSLGPGRQSIPAGGSDEVPAYGDPRLEYLQDLRDRFPDDPALLAHTLRYYSQRNLHVRRTEASSYVRETAVLAPAVVSQVEEQAREGARIDPENGYFPTMLACAYFAATRDAEGLALLREASHKPKWNDYAVLEGFGGRDLLLQAYPNRGFWMQGRSLYAVVLPHFAEIRAAARCAVWRAQQLADQGDVGSELAVRADVIRLGALLRRDGGTVIGRLVGAAVQDVGFGAQGLRRQGETLDRSRWEAYEHLTERVRREAPNLAPFLRAEADALVQFRADHEAYLPAWSDRLTDLQRAAEARDVAGLLLLGNLAMALLVWLVAAGLLWVKPGRVRLDILGRARWLWHDGPSLLRIAVLTAWCVLVLFLFLMGSLAVWPSALVLGIILVLSAALSAKSASSHAWSPENARPGSARSWSTWLVTGLAAMIMGAALHPLDVSVPWAVHYWKEALPWFTPGVREPGVAPQGSALLPYPAGWAVLLAALAVALLRRSGIRGVLEGARTGGRAVAGVLAVCYLAYLLAAVPANLQAGRALEAMLIAEIEARQW